MAARYVDTANIVAQGQSFYTGLLPGSYEQQAGGAPRGGNVYGKGSGGSANVTADRTASEAAGMSIAHKAQKGPTPGSIFMGTKEAPPEVRVSNMPPGGLQGPQGGGPQGQNPAPGLPTPGGPQGQNPAPGLPWGQNQGPATAPTGGMGTGQKTQHQGGGFAKAAGTAVGLGAQGYVTAKTGKPALGKVAGVAASKVTEHGVGKMEDKLSESPIGRAVQQGANDYIKDSSMGQWEGAVQRRASTRSQTRQSGVQQSATHKSFLYPNMANSTNRALNF